MQSPPKRLNTVPCFLNKISGERELREIDMVLGWLGLVLRSLALGSVALGILAPIGVAGAADLYDGPPPPYQAPPPAQYYPPQPPAVVPYGPPVVQAPIEGCRVIVRPGFDAYGRQVFRRVRICEEDEVAVAPAYPAPPPPRYGYGYRPGYYDPQPYGWR